MKVRNVNSLPNGQTGYKWIKGKKEGNKKMETKVDEEEERMVPAQQMGQGERTGLVAELEQARYAKFGT